MISISIYRATTAVALILALVLSATSVFADAKHGHGQAMAIGEPGTTAEASRTVEIKMYDNYYKPKSISVKEGETVRFIVHNAGKFVHEFNIATAKMHAAHQSEMMMMTEHGVLEPDRISWDAAKAMQAAMGHGMHDDPNSVLLEPGKTAEIVWKFPKHADLEFACNVPGHYDAGMMGKIKLSH